MRSRSAISRSLILLAALATAGCATKSTTPRAAAKDPNLITIDELQRSDASNLRDAIARLRPQFLRSRGAVSINDPTPPTAVVYLDGQRVGGLEFLERMSPMGVFSVRYMSPVDASSRYGLNHEGGAILISTRRATPQQTP